MIYIIISVFFLWFDRGKRLSWFFFFILLVSSIAAYLVGRQPQLEFTTQFWTLYTGVLLAVLFHAFNGYKIENVEHWKDIEPKTVDKYARWILILGMLALFINVFLLTKVFSALITGAIVDAGKFKNEGDAAEFYASLFPHSVMVFSYLFSPVAYVALPLHFYYLCKKKKKESLLFLLVSLLIVISGLVYLSRSATVQYVIVYAAYFIFISPLFSKKIRKKAVTIATVSFIGIFAALNLVSSSRFSDYYTKNSLNPAILDERDNPLLFSTLDYFSEWEENGPKIMRKHDISHTYFGLYNSCGIAAHLFSTQYNNSLAEMERYLGDSHNSFHGLIARLLFDYGKIGTILFIILLSKLIKKMGPRKGSVRFKTLLLLSSILPVCALFFAGNQFASVYLDIGIVYCLVFYKLVKVKTSIKPDLSVTT